MIREIGTAGWTVRLVVPRTDGVLAWGHESGNFERRLEAQASAMVIEPRLDGEIRRGRSSVRVAVAMTIRAADVAQALTIAWRAFRRAAGDDTEGWDVENASAEVRPGLIRSP